MSPLHPGTDTDIKLNPALLEGLARTLSLSGTGITGVTGVKKEGEMKMQRDWTITGFIDVYIYIIIYFCVVILVSSIFLLSLHP